MSDSPVAILQAIFVVTCLLVVLRLVYNLFFHPLASFKGPRWLAASDISLAIISLRGISHHTIHAAHQKYGSVVRIGPNTLSYIDPAAWTDIYGHQKGRRSIAVLPKDPLFYNEMLLDRKTIGIASDEEAAPIRRSMNAAFSHKALLEQEPMMREHAERLVSRLKDQAVAGNSADMQQWLTFSMFDLTSEFAFGEDMGCVKEGHFHEWVQFVVSVFYAATLLHQCHKFWPLNRLLAMLIPPSMRHKHARHNSVALQRVRKRLASDTARHDFMYYFLRQAEKESLSLPVIEAQAAVIILAGSEPSAVTLTGAIYEILSHPEIHCKLKEEIRATFEKAEDISLTKVLSALPYLQVVVQETLRLHTPLANGFNRWVPPGGEGASICGAWVPPDTVVTINHYCATRSEANFRDPHEFVPDRWTGSPEYASDKREIVQPFSVGPRNCPGKTFALYNIYFTLTHLFWHFDMELGSGTEGWSKGQKLYNGWVQPPLPVTLKARIKSQL